MKEKIQQLLGEIEQLVVESAEQAEEIRIKYLGRKGILNDLLEEFKQVEPALKKELGQALNTFKNTAQERITLWKEQFETGAQAVNNTIDLSRPVIESELGSRHPLSLVKNEILDIFQRIGFSIADGPEIEDDWHNFSALNFPPEHPARDMQDTFFIEKDPDIALRTHTSSVQIRIMENTKPPIRILMPGRVYRNEAISARAHIQFHQIEGLYIDKEVSFADLKQTLLYFAQEMFGEHTQIRMRPSFFPFTEPSAEVDVTCSLCGGKGCNVCKYSGWLEILGCGMVHPNVLENCGIDSKEYSGFAFGMGVERIAMLKYQIKDLRLFFENDMRFLRQFKGSSQL
jgi:phenylalanyl-tRNA synthetase alpha chain